MLGPWVAWEEEAHAHAIHNKVEMGFHTTAGWRARSPLSREPHISTRAVAVPPKSWRSGVAGGCPSHVCLLYVL